ncbi:MAG: BON domain-containing protein [Gammaproteobacteria bacterium]|nr:BON domain-containing protein [Gammaproteobacteria bacterium]MDP2140720.1 BON domain-containing protein [Gammaproteobacteria bacterium]MDP2346974.1 BON domain-containing protein [Gammaproteobacteria bacterium]
MKKAQMKLLPASIIALSLTALSAGVLAQSSSPEISAARQEAQIETTFELSPYLRGHNIDANVMAGKATLTGIVDEDITRDLAQQIALGVSGIESVDNQIEVKEDVVRATPDANQRSFGTVVDDASITAAVKSKLLWSRYTDGLKTEVSTENGVVTLRGTADSAEARELADMLAENTNGVVSVKNELTVQRGSTTAASEGTTADSAGQAISDTWITTKVKSTFTMSSNVHSRDISVTTTDGVVELSGMVRSAAEHELAILLATNVRGVNRVDADDLSH